VLFRSVVFSVAKSLGVTAYRVLAAHHMNRERIGKRYYFCPNEFGDLPGGKPLFDHDPDMLDGFVRDFLKRVKERTYRFDQYSRTTGRSWRMSSTLTAALLDIGRYIWASCNGRWLAANKLRTRGKSYFRYLSQRVLLAKIVNRSDPYIVFPLNVHDDAQLTLRAREWADLEGTIRLVASNMPPGIKLLIKPHPGHPGMLESKLIRRLKKDFDGVGFISPDIDLIDLVKDAAAVLVINGSVALESALIGTPVLYLGRYFYAKLPNCTRIDNLAGFPSKVGSVVQRPKEIKIEAIRDLLKEYYGFTYPLINNKCVNERSIVETIAGGICAISTQHKL